MLDIIGVHKDFSILIIYIGKQKKFNQTFKNSHCKLSKNLNPSAVGFQ